MNPMRWLSITSSIFKKARLIATFKRDTLNHQQPIAPHLALGHRGEQLARAHLVRLGYQIVATNFKLPVGRNLRNAIVHAEIDIIAYDAAMLCFVEVKTRRSREFAAPEANVDLRKQRQISRAARAYRRTFSLTAAPYRYDVVSVVLREATPLQQAAGTLPPSPEIELLRNYWTDAKLRKRHWSDAPMDW